MNMFSVGTPARSPLGKLTSRGLTQESSAVTLGLRSVLLGASNSADNRSVSCAARADNTPWQVATNARGRQVEIKDLGSQL